MSSLSSRHGDVFIRQLWAHPLYARVYPALGFVGSFHLRMAFWISILALVSLAGCILTDIQVPGFGAVALGVLAIAGMLLPLPVYWYEKNRVDLLDSSLTVLWALMESVIIPFPVRIAARLRMPLQDSFLGSADRHLGVNLTAIVEWASHHWLGSILNKSYELVIILLPIAVLAPILAGKLKYAKELVVANLISFAIGIPTFALLPAIGPWISFHFPPNQVQETLCQAELLALRLPGAYVLRSQAAGVVCFPSFHVAWAVFGVAALWGFRWLRIPLAALGGMIIVSTMTTGWHYFTDVLGGIVVAIISLVLAKLYLRPGTELGNTTQPPTLKVYRVDDLGAEPRPSA